MVPISSPLRPAGQPVQAGRTVRLGLSALLWLSLLMSPSLMAQSGFDYAAHWKKVDSLANQRLNRDAAALAAEIETQARAEGNVVQALRGMLHVMRFRRDYLEQADSLNIATIRTRLREASGVEEAILQSLLAETYMQYYEANRWEISDRTAQAEANEDVATWDPASFLRESGRLYLASLAPAGLLRIAKVEDYRPLLDTSEGSARYRPTLYDLLAHRALDHFSNSGNVLPEPTAPFVLPLAQAMLPTDQFAAVDFAPADTNSPRYRVVRLYQTLIDFHNERQDPYALMDLELKRLAFARQEATGPDKEAAYLAALEQLAGWYSHHPVEADARYEIARWHMGQAQGYAPFDLESKGKDSYRQAFDICRATVDEYPGSRGAVNCTALMSRIREKRLALQCERYVTPNQPFLVSVNFRNLDRLFFRAVALTPALRDSLASQRRRQVAERLALLRAAPAVRSWTQPLPEARDFHAHRTEIAALSLEVGEYILLASDTRDFTHEGHAVAMIEVQVTAMAVTGFTEADGRRVYYLTDRQSGAPLAGVSARVTLDEPNRPIGQPEPLALDTTLTTDAQGRVVLDFLPPRRYFRLRFSRGQDVLDTGSGYSYRPEMPETVRERTVFFTDRRIYRPGQTIYFKAIALEMEGEAVRIRPQHPMKVTLYDVNGQAVQSLELVTNAFGSVKGEFVAPNTGLTGGMRLETDHGYYDISVEEYKRPTFEVRFEPVQGSYALGDSVTVTGLAEAYSGAKLDGASVQYRVVREARFPYWFFWWRRPPRGDRAEIAQGEVLTQPDGSFAVTFVLRPDAGVDPDEKPVFTYTLYADVTDITGETHSNQTTLQAAYVPLEVGMQLPETLFQEDAAALTLEAHNLSGEPETATGVLTLYPLENPGRNFRPRPWERPDLHLYTEAEYRKRFPHDLYAEEDQPATWPAGKALLSQPVQWTGTESLPLPQLATATPGAYKAVLELPETGITVVRYFTLGRRAATRPPVPTWLAVDMSQTQAEPGETVQVTLRTTESKLWVQYQLSFKGEPIVEEVIALTDAGHRLEIPVAEAHRGGLTLNFMAVSQGHMISRQASLSVPWTNKQLDLRWQTFRSELLPGQQEEWRLTIKGPQAEAVSAELVATLYDASLDVFRPQQFDLTLYPSYGYRLNLLNAGFGAGYSQLFSEDWNTYAQGYSQGYDQFNWCGFGISSRWQYMVRSGVMPAMSAVSLPKAAPAPGGTWGGEERMEAEFSDMSLDDSDGVPDLFDSLGETPAPPSAEPPALRTNLSETAFFFPQLQTNAEGEIVLAFTMPEALTRWKFLGLAHTQDLKVGTLSGTTVTQKDLMVVPSLPRFVREGDEVLLTAKVVNLAETALSGMARLSLLDAMSGEDAGPQLGLAAAAQPFEVEAGRSIVLQWPITVPEGGLQTLMTRFVAEAGAFSDGQENVLPVLTNRILVTETQPLLIRGRKKRQTVRFDKLLASGDSPTLRHERLTLEMTTNPAWYAVQALPYLMEFPHACTEQIYARFYANALATHIATATPRLQEVFSQWQQLPADAALLSNLEKNQDLKNALLTETPWVLEAQSETERKRQIGVLFDLGRMSKELQQALQQLAQRQSYNGAFSWFPGMPESRYITQLIATGIGQLNHLGISVYGDQERTGMAQAAVSYLDAEVAEDYQRLLDIKAPLNENHLSASHIQYLYMRSYYEGSSLDDRHRTAYDYYYGQARQYWNKQSLYMMGMLALVFHRNGDAALAAQLIEALRQNAVTNPKLGMYWKGPGGYFWYQAPIERQALFIEAFAEVAGDTEAVDEMRVWLLQNKRTNDWGTTRATAAACHALLQRGTDWLGAAPTVNVRLGEIEVDPATRPDAAVEAGTGYYRTTWTASEVQPEMGTIKLSRDGDGVAWGALYWQYFEQMDKVTYAETPLSIRKQLFREENTPSGPVLQPVGPEPVLAPGDKLVIRIELRVDRDMEYVHLKDLRAAGLEPINVLSGYRYQGGLGYYESTRDLATHFFFDHLSQGTWVLEYPLRVTHQGDFSHGITTAQCMYAPEFTSHSAGIRLQVRE